MLRPAALYASTLNRLPPVPSTVPIFKTTVTTTTDENTSTFTDVDIGVPHPLRLVILAVYQGQTNQPSSTVNGIPHQTRIHSSEFGILSQCVPTGQTATITVTAASSVRKAVSVYVAYPRNHIPLDFAIGSAAAGSSATAADVKAQAGGFLIYSGGQNATLSTFTVTWNGVDGTSEQVDAQLEGVASYTSGLINFTQSSDGDDLSLAASTSGLKRIAAASWF